MSAHTPTPQGITNEAHVLAARQSAARLQLDMLLNRRGPVAEVRRLVADLDRIAEDLAATLRASPNKTP